MTHRCGQCGRVGVRGFRIIEPVYIERFDMWTGTAGGVRVRGGLLASAASCKVRQ